MHIAYYCLTPVRCQINAQAQHSTETDVIRCDQADKSADSLRSQGSGSLLG